MKRTVTTTLALALACSAPAIAADLDSSISLGGSYANLHGQKAKANEYRALGTGAYGGLDLNYRTPEYFLDVDANLLINDGKSADSSVATDNNLLIKGGITDTAKLSLYYNEIPHNLTYGAKTYFTGVGTANLVGQAPPATTSAVLNAAYMNTPLSSFDYAIKRTNYGAEAEMSFKTPFFFLVRLDRTETKGIQPDNISPNGAIIKELPAPVDYTTSTANLQTGYRSKRLIATLDGVISDFTNANNFLSVQQGATPTTTLFNQSYLPPDNMYYKVGGSITYRTSFLNTVLMARGSHSILSNSPNIDEQTTIALANGVPANTHTMLNWNGLVKYTTASASVTSNPIRNLDTRITYNFLERSNESDAINNVAYNGTNYNVPPRVSHHKQSAGLDVSYKLPAATKVSAGYEYNNTIRGTFWTTQPTNSGNPAAISTADHVVYAQVKNNLLEVVSGKLRYEHLTRNSKYEEEVAYSLTSYAKDFRGFEAAKNGRDTIKAELEFEPLHGLDLGLQYAFVRNNYTNSPYGVKNDTRHEVYADSTYTAGIGKFNLYGEAETTKKIQAHFAGNTTLAPATTAPSAAQIALGINYGTTTNYYRESKRQDFNYALGGKAEIDIIKNKLKASLGYRYQKASGSDQFSYSTAIQQPVANTDTLDNCIKQSLNTKLTYEVSQNLSLDLSYLYEHMKFSDNAYDGYQYLVSSRSASAATLGNYSYQVLSGAYNNPNYDANVFYLGMKYKF